MEHGHKHKEDCEKRVLHDELLFRQPENSYLGECPICFLPQSLDETKCTLMVCCGKLICNGCNWANQKREKEGKLKIKCAFCREPISETFADGQKIIEKKAKMNEPKSLREVGIKLYDKGQFQKAFDYFSKAATLDDAVAHYYLAYMYLHKQGVEKDSSKVLFHYEMSAIGGHHLARFNLANIEFCNLRYERAVKHWIIAAKQGETQSLHNLKEAYREGLISKDDYADALRAHQDAIEAVRSPQRAEFDALLVTGKVYFY